MDLPTSESSPSNCTESKESKDNDGFVNEVINHLILHAFKIFIFFLQGQGLPVYLQI